MCCRLGVFFVLSGVAAIGGISGCSGGGGANAPSPSTAAPPPIVVATTFPASSATAAGGGTAWAITGVRTTLTGSGTDAYGSPYDTLAVAVTFAQDVTSALPPPGATLARPGQLGVFIGLETRGSGGYADCRGRLVLDYGSDPGVVPSRLLDGNYNILSAGLGGPLLNGNAGGTPLDEAVTSVSGHVLTQTFRLLAVDGLSTTGPPQIGVVVGSFNGAATTKATDCVPVSGAIAAGR